jgi:large subunit ribosomal protein L18
MGIKNKQQLRNRRKKKIRTKIQGTKDRPRLSVFRSNTSLFIQLIDDQAGKTLASAHSREIKLKGKKPDKKMSPGLLVGFELGKLLAEKAKKKNISEAVFDRGGYKYHGRVKAVSEGAREAGLKF